MLFRACSSWPLDYFHLGFASIVLLLGIVFTLKLSFLRFWRNAYSSGGDEAIRAIKNASLLPLRRRCTLAELHLVDYADYHDYGDDNKNQYWFLIQISSFRPEAFSLERVLTPKEALDKGRDEADLDEQANHRLEGRENDLWISYRPRQILCRAAGSTKLFQAWLFSLRLSLCLPPLSDSTF